MKYAILVAAFLPVAAVAQEPKPEPNSAGIANPASQYCEEVGGTLEIRAEQNGEVGFCNLPDGRVVEEWTLFREESADAPKAKGIEPAPVAAETAPDAAETEEPVAPTDVPGVQPLPPTTPVPEVLDTPDAEPLPEPDGAPDASDPSAEPAPIADEPAPETAPEAN